MKTSYPYLPSKVKMDRRKARHGFGIYKYIDT